MVIELSPFYGINNEFDRLMDSFFTPLSFSQRRVAYPPLNISEDDDNIYVECEAPGVEIKDIEITLCDGSLSIKGERKPREGKYYRQERATGLFQRVVNLNSEIDRDKVKASLKDGILSIALPKAEEMKPKTISIEAK